MVGFSTGARHGLSYIPESVFGTTPGTPAMKSIRMTGTTLGPRREQIQPAELRSDRQIEDSRPGNKQLQGNIGFEASYGAFDELLPGALFGAWTSDVLKAGVTPTSYTLERMFTDIGRYWRMYGVMFSILTLRLQPNAFVMGTLEAVGKGMAVGSSSLDAPDIPASNPPFDTFTGSITEGGVAIAKVTTLDLRLDNGLQPTFVLFNSEAPQIIPRRSNLTGTMTCYVEDDALMTKFLAGTESSLTLVLTDPLLNSLTIALPRIIYTGADTPASDEGPIMQTLPFQALKDDTLGSQISITRAPHP